MGAADGRAFREAPVGQVTAREVTRSTGRRNRDAERRAKARTSRMPLATTEPGSKSVTGSLRQEFDATVQRHGCHRSSLVGVVLALAIAVGCTGGGAQAPCGALGLALLRGSLTLERSPYKAVGPVVLAKHAEAGIGAAATASGIQLSGEWRDYQPQEPLEATPNRTDTLVLDVSVVMLDSSVPVPLTSRHVPITVVLSVRREGSTATIVRAVGRSSSEKGFDAGVRTGSATAFAELRSALGEKMPSGPRCN